LDTLKTVVDIAVEIGREGREGKPIGHDVRRQAIRGKVLARVTRLFRPGARL